MPPFRRRTIDQTLGPLQVDRWTGAWLGRGEAGALAQGRGCAIVLDGNGRLYARSRERDCGLFALLLPSRHIAIGVPCDQRPKQGPHAEQYVVRRILVRNLHPR